jgi:hypothetical protein
VLHATMQTCAYHSTEKEEYNDAHCNTAVSSAARTCLFHGGNFRERNGTFKGSTKARTAKNPVSRNDERNRLCDLVLSLESFERREAVTPYCLTPGYGADIIFRSAVIYSTRYFLLSQICNKIPSVFSSCHFRLIRPQLKDFQGLGGDFRRKSLLLVCCFWGHPLNSLSDDDIRKYLHGEWMGLAKPAELNRYPGTRHLDGTC